MRTSSTRRLGALSIAGLLALVFSLASPSLAGAKDRGDDGGREAAERPSVSGSTDDDSAADTDPADADADNAHPSGNDRHEDKGVQGHSTSDPDDDGRGPDRSNGGADKPFVAGDGAGGVDEQDQDGNNGCGNDDDFEDDNEGWCGKPADVDDDEDVKDVPDDAVTTETLATGAVLGTDLQPSPAGESASVLGVQLERTVPAVAAAGAATAPDGTQVLGVALARTGLGFTVVALAVALGLLSVGFALKRSARREPSI